MQSDAVLLLGLSRDEADAVRQAAEAGEDSQCRVMEAKTPQEAWAFMEGGAPAVLVVGDARLLEKAGTFLQRVREERRESGLRSLLIMRPERGGGESPDEAAQTAFDDLLFLPADAGELSARLRFQLAKARREGARQEHFQRIESTAGIAYWEYDSVRKQIIWSETMYALLGYQIWEVTPTLELIREHVYPEDLDGVDQALHALCERKDMDVTFRYLHRDGEVRFARLQGEASGRGSGLLVGTFQDVTQRKRVENKLVELLEQTQMRSRETQAMLEGTKAILEYQRFHEAIRKIMAECRKLIGGEVAFAGLFDALGEGPVPVHWRDTQQGAGLEELSAGRLEENALWKRIRAAQTALRLNEPEGFEAAELFPGRPLKENLLAAPVTIEGESSAVILLADKPSGFTENDASMLSAFTELVAVSLRNSRNLEQMATLATALEQGGEGVIITDAAFQVVYVNPAFERMSGFSGSEIVEGFPDLLCSPEERPVFEEAWKRVQNGEIWRGQLLGERKDGTSYRMDASASPIADQDGRISNYLVILQDITEKLELERQLRQSQKMEAIGTLAGGIAHDFNNMLMGIMGFTEMARRALPEDRHQERRYLDSVLKSINRAKDLVHQILTFSRQKETSKRPLKVEPVLKEVLKLLQASLPSNIEITCNIEPEAPKVTADPAQMHQMVMNLCTNAAQAMPEGGSLAIRLASAALDEADSRTFKGLGPGKYLLLEVEDTGDGISPELRDRIFEPFFTTKAQDQGTGMGLAVIHGIVTELSGEIQVSSAPGQGSTFSIYLPATEGREEPRPAQRTAPDKPARGKGRILFVDDEEEIVHWGVRSLEQLGYRVTGTSDTQQAWEIIQEEAAQIDLVVTDLTMPKMSGRELIQRTREIRRDLPIILCTGYSEQMQPEQGSSNGADALLLKPFSMAEFSWTVRTVLEQSKASQMREEKSALVG